MGEDQIEVAKEKHQGWVASLSSGETIFQTPTLPKVLSPWNQLLARCEEEDIYITQIQLQLHGITLVGMTNADGYTAFYDQAQSAFNPERVDTYQGIGSVLGDWLICTATNESRHVWQSFRQLADMRPICQMKPTSALRPLTPRPAMPAKPAQPTAGIQVLDISDASEEERSEEEFNLVSDWFQSKASGFYRNKDIKYIAYVVHKNTGVDLEPEELEEFIVAFWK